MNRTSVFFVAALFLAAGSLIGWMLQPRVASTIQNASALNDEANSDSPASNSTDERPVVTTIELGSYKSGDFIELADQVKWLQDPSSIEFTRLYSKAYKSLSSMGERGLQQLLEQTAIRR